MLKDAGKTRKKKVIIMDTKSYTNFAPEIRPGKCSENRQKVRRLRAQGAPSPVMARPYQEGQHRCSYPD
jgi:hypothetical protein